MNFWSHSPISVVRFRFSSALASSAVGRGSPLWCSQYSKTFAIKRDQSTRVSICVAQKSLTFFSTDEETLGNGIGWSLSPTSVGEKRGLDMEWRKAAAEGGGGELAFEHVLDEDAAFSNFLVDDELFVIGGDEENHYRLGGFQGWRWR